MAQLLDAVFGESGDQAVFALDDGGQIGAWFDGEQAEFGGAPHQGDDLRRAQKGFGRHAAAQDAQTAQGTVVDDGDVGAFVAGGAGGGVPGRAAADDDDVVLHEREILFLKFRDFGVIINTSRK